MEVIDMTATDVAIAVDLSMWKMKYDVANTRRSAPEPVIEVRNPPIKPKRIIDNVYALIEIMTSQCRHEVLIVKRDNRSNCPFSQCCIV